MTKSRKLSILIFSFLLVIASFIFVSCGKINYSKTYLSSSVGGQLELYVGEEQEITIKIENPVDKMNKGLKFTSSTPQVVFIKQITNQGASTIYSITGLAGGVTNVEFKSIEGLKTYNLSVKVREYSDKLTSGDNSLYVSNTKTLTPTYADFNFKEGSTEKNLDFYFYGINNVKGSLNELDITASGELQNKFVSLSHYSSNGKDYLIFVNDSGQLFTLGKAITVAGSDNTKYSFIEVANNDGEYSFNESQASSIMPGQTFTFMARYVNTPLDSEEEPTILLCEREFVFLSDIDSKKISHVYGYKINDVEFVPENENTSYKIEENQSGNITLIPDYTSIIKDNPFLAGYKANFLTAYLEVTAPTNDLLVLNAYSQDSSAITSKIITSLKMGEFTKYYIEINCARGFAGSTNFVLNFYYQGFEDNNDENVNYSYIIPVEIRIIPTKLLINNVNFSQVDKVFKFYNYYVGDAGWQAFNFSVIPEGAEYERLIIDLTGSKLQLKHSNESTIYRDCEVEITNLNETVYIKGDEAEASSEILSLPVRMDFDVIQKDSLNTAIKYEVVNGASELTFETEKFKEGIYLERFSDSQNFLDLYANAEFSNIDFSLESGKNVVNFELGEELFILDSGKYYLNINMTPVDTGSGTYNVTLDNGKNISITIIVREALNSITLKTINEDNSIKLKEDNENTTLIYLLNKNGKSYFDIELIANGREKSQAIIDVDVKISTSYITMQTTEDGRYLFYSPFNGSQQITFEVAGYKVEDFTSERIVSQYFIQVVTYDLAGGLNVYKVRDGFKEGEYQNQTSANYLNVYSNTYFDNLRQAEIEVGINNKDAYLFQNPESGNYVESNFDNSYLYFESDTLIYRNSVAVNKIYYSQVQNNIYTIGSFGTFDSEKLIFTAFDNLSNSVKIKLIAHVMQYGKLYSFTININIEVYREVDSVTLQNPVKDIEFSGLKPEFSLIAYPSNNDATNPNIVALFVGGQVTNNDETYVILDEDSLSYIKSAGKTQITFTISDKYMQFAESYHGEQALGCEILIVASDWLDSSGNLRSGYYEKAISIDAKFANGDVNHRFTINDAQDLLLIKNNLSAHYKLKSSIDVSAIISEFPLGELKGSIVGESDFAAFTGITISKATTIDNNDYYGLFTKIAHDAFIEYVKFEGNFNITVDERNSYIGLIAGENNGELINVGVTLNHSTVDITDNANSYVGGVVGVNNGSMIQDFTLFETGNVVNDGRGRINYSSFSPVIMVYMNDYLNIIYIPGSANKLIGGLCGENSGIIRKIDSLRDVYSGQLNYMAYSLIKATTSSSASSHSVLNCYVGGIVGGYSNNGTVNPMVSGGYKLATGQYKSYVSYNTTDVEDNTLFTAGKGLLVGGVVYGQGYVGGVIGRIDNLRDGESLAGITTRTFVRAEQVGQTSSTSLALIANVIKTSATAIPTSYAVQAIDDGRINEESAMAVLYSSSLAEDYTFDYNKLGFGNFGHGIASLMSGDVNKNVMSYVTRQPILGENGKVTINNSSKDVYYGDYLVVGKANNQRVTLFQKEFEKGGAFNLYLEQNFNNKLNGAGNDMYYAYYFEVGALVDSNADLTQIQSLLNEKFNTLNVKDALYPFVAHGEMTFTSKSTDILSIDYSGKITIKKTGLALISATSLLNSNNSLSFYIYVVNYFNSESLSEDKSSIVYASSTASSDPIDTTTIELRGNNTATLYVIPRYDFVDAERGLKSNIKGEASINGVAFYMATNNDVTAKYSLNMQDGNSQLGVTISGQSITVKRANDSLEGIYQLVLEPTLTRVVNGIEYSIAVNKTLNNVRVDYRYGALDINNKNFNGVPIFTGDEINEVVSILTTDKNEKSPKYYILGLDKEFLQGDIENIEYQENLNPLFNVSIKPNGESEDLKNGTYRCLYDITITINTNSPIYSQRYEKTIYGKYYLYLQTSSNSSKSLLIEIEFEKTSVSSAVIDSYLSYDEINKDLALSTTTDYTYPGESGLLAITVNPADSDFDYVLIENDESNYNNGNSSAIFSIVTRKATGKKLLFDDSIIKGSSVARGIKITLKDLIDAYSGEDNVNYDGTIYVKYNFSSNNVNDFSTSKINFSVYKDGAKVFDSSKEITIKIQNFVAVGIEGKDSITSNQLGVYKSYEVARGMKYKLYIDSYGFKQDNIVITSNNPSIAQISQENGSYYLTITEGNISYDNGENVVKIISAATQQDGDKIRTAESVTEITIYEYVMQYNDDKHDNSDIVRGMNNGIINVQVGTKVTYSIDLYDYIEYNPNINGVVNKIDEFMASLANNGTWKTYTNLISDDLPDYRMATKDNGREKYILKDSTTQKNYYFYADGLSVIPRRTHLPEDKFYFFEYTGYYKAENGVYSVQPLTEGNSYRRITTDFVLNVYSTSSKESPIPIYNYDDFTKMQTGGYYILLNDITLPSVDDADSGIKAFEPQVASFASLDGNGHAINFAGIYDMGARDNFGLFTNVNDGTVIKNLIVNYTSSVDGNDLNTDESDSVYGLFGLRTVKFVTSADNFTFGTIAAQNSGIITNCQVITDVVAGNEYYITVKADNALTANNNAAGLVGFNNGYITNCGVSANIKMPFNVAGLVAQNSGKIAASYFEGGKIINNSNYDQHAAGLVLANSAAGQIITSYVAGTTTNDSLYSKNTDNYIMSTFAAGGFVYNNLGTIKDCYTDIYLARTSSDMAGFVFNNGGTVRNCFSLSILRSGTTASAGFARNNTFQGASGKFENCYYFYDDENKINISLYNVKYDGVERLTESQFAEIDKYFADYSFDANVSSRAVWFFSEGVSSNEYYKFVPTTEKIVIPTDSEDESGTLSQSNTVYNKELMELGKGRLTLVAPNIRALSMRNFESSEIDESTGNITYFYVDDSSTPARGTNHNPRLITDYFDMENEILNQTASNNINTTSYRIVSDINYLDFEEHSSLYRVIYAGNMEGNGMEVYGMGLVAMNARASGGLFSQIGYSATRIGSVKNLKVSPKEVVFNNTNAVGTLAGRLSYGYIYDINVDSARYGLESISGLNFVGGIIGKATDKFEAKDIYSNVNVWSVFAPSDDNGPYVENQGQDSSYSYAGGLIGYVGRGSVYNGHVYDINSITGDRAGLAYGGIGQGGEVKYTFVDVYHGAKIKSNHFAGYVVGENAGKLAYAYVSDNGDIESSFMNIPKAATGVGGIAGMLCGGEITNAKLDQRFRVTNNVNENAIKYVGGLVGVVRDSKIQSVLKQSIVNCDISTSTNLGGAIAFVESPTTINEVAVKSSLLSITGNVANPMLGGIVGGVSEVSSATLEINNSYCLADLDIITYTVGTSSTARVGGLVGYTGENKKHINLSYCYTTSKINAEVYDSRALGSTKEYEDPKENEPSDTLKGFTHNIDNSNYDNVYYFGKNSSNYSDMKDYLTFKLKVKSMPIKLEVNNFGVSSDTYVNNIIYASMDSARNPNCYYGLFGANYLVSGENILEETRPATEADENVKTGDIPNIVSGVEYEAIYNSINKSFNVRLPYNNGEKYFSFKYDPNTDNSYVLKIKNNDMIYTYTLNPNNMTNVLIYRNAKGEYIKAPGEGNVEVWYISDKTFSSLTTETSFDWLNKL